MKLEYRRSWNDEWIVRFERVSESLKVSGLLFFLMYFHVCECMCVLYASHPSHGIDAFITFHVLLVTLAIHCRLCMERKTHAILSAWQIEALSVNVSTNLLCVCVSYVRTWCRCNDEVCMFLYWSIVFVRYFALQGVRWLLSIQFQLLHIYEWKKNKRNFLMRFALCILWQVCCCDSISLLMPGNQMWQTYTCSARNTHKIKRQQTKRFSANIHALIHSLIQKWIETLHACVGQLK